MWCDVGVFPSARLTEDRAGNSEQGRNWEKMPKKHSVDSRLNYKEDWKKALSPVVI